MQAPAFFGHHAGHVAAPQHTCHILTTLLPEIHQGLALQLVNASNQFLLGIENGCNPQTMHCAQMYSDMILLMINQHGEILEKWSAVRGPLVHKFGTLWNQSKSTKWRCDQRLKLLQNLPHCHLLQFGSVWVSQHISRICVLFFHHAHRVFTLFLWLSPGIPWPPIDPGRSWSRCQKRKPPAPAAPAAPAAPQALRCSSARDKDGNSCRTWRRPNDVGCGLIMFNGSPSIDLLVVNLSQKKKTRSRKSSVIDRMGGGTKWPEGNATFWVFVYLKKQQTCSHSIQTYSNTTRNNPKLIESSRPFFERNWEAAFGCWNLKLW